MLAQIEHVGRFEHGPEADLLLHHEAAVISARDLLVADRVVGSDRRNAGAARQARNPVEGGVVDRAVVDVGRIAGEVLRDLGGGEVEELAEAGADGGLAVAEHVPCEAEAEGGNHDSIRSTA